MPDPLHWIIYTLKNPRTDEVRYVGWTSGTANRRMNTHIQEAINKPKNHRAKWILSLLSAGIRPVMEVVETGSGDGWAEAERRWIASLRAQGVRLTNRTDGGEGTLGYVPTPETRKRISEAGKGRKLSPENLAKLQAAAQAANLGRKLTAEVREAMSKARKGRRHTPEAIANMKAAAKLRDFHVSAETRAKVSQTHKGKVVSPETRTKMSAARKRRVISAETRAKISATYWRNHSAKGGAR